MLTIDRNGTLFLNDDLVSTVEFRQRLRNLLAAPTAPSILVLRADRRVTLEDAVAVMDLAKQAGANKFVIATQEIEVD